MLKTNIFREVSRETCPICREKPIGKNCWVRYHISYKPELVILACKYCNFIENKLRHCEPISKNVWTKEWKRANKIIKFHEKFGLKI